MFEMLISEQSSNCKYFISDILFIVAILGHFKDAKDKEEAMSKFFKEIQNVINLFNIFLDDLVDIAVKKYLGQEFTVIDIPDPRKVTIPCFFETKIIK